MAPQNPHGFRPSRRAVLLGGAGLAALGAVGAVFGSRGLWQARAFEDGVAGVVARIFGAGSATPEVIAPLARDVLAQSEASGILYRPTRIMLTASADLPFLHGLVQEPLEGVEDIVAQNFLRNTNYVWRAADEPLTYSPPSHAANTCSNPFARFGFDDD